MSNNSNVNVNLPPGMIPGNRPEDIEFDKCLEKLIAALVTAGVEAKELNIVADVGIQAVRVARLHAKEHLKDFIEECGYCVACDDSCPACGLSRGDKKQ